MDSVQALEEALALARQLGFDVREDSLGGAGGACRLKGRKLLLLDLSQPPRERLAVVLDALRSTPDVGKHAKSPALRRLLELDRAA